MSAKILAPALRRAIGAALLADADLAAALGGPNIYDTAPRAAPFPFVALTESSEADWSSVAEAGAELRLTLHVASRAADQREAWAILGILMRRLHDAPLPLSGADLVLLAVTNAEVRADADGVTQHGFLRLKALAEPSD